MPAPTPIALCITDLDPGGAERALVQVVTRLPRDLWAPVVYCLGPRGELVDDLEAAGVQTCCLNAGRWDIFVVWRLAKLLKAQRPALVQTFLFHANLAGRLAAKLAGVPIVVSGIRVAERGKRWHVRLERWTRSLVAHHVCVSKAVAEFAKRELRLSDDDVSVIYNGIDLEAYASAPPADLTHFGIPRDAITLLFVGRLHPQKGLSLLLEAFEDVSAEHPAVHLLIVGHGPLEHEIRSFVRAHALESRVHLAGHRRDVPSLMRAATALVLPSLWEGLPNVVLEAMASGLPVLATAVDGTRELIEHGMTGWLCTPDSKEALADGLRQVLRQTSVDRAVIAAAQGNAVQEFTWDMATFRYIHLWRCLMDPRPIR